MRWRSRRTSPCPCRRRRRDTDRRVVALDLRRRHDLVADAVVGEVEQPAQVVLVAGDAFLHEGVAVGTRRRALQHEAALRADRHDHGVLHHLRLDEAQHLGAEVLRPVGPAQAAARDLAAAQVHALEARRVDEDLEHRLRLGQPGHLGRIELERQEAARARPAASRRQKLVRVVARISARYWRSTRSSDRLSTRSSAASIARTCSAARATGAGAARPDRSAS